VFVRDAARVRKRRSLASWLYGVAYRLSLRVARQKHRRRETSLVDENLVDDDTLEKLTDRHDQQLVDIELNALPERYRQPLVLKYLSGHSTIDIADELGTTVGAVEGLLKRGKDELRRRLLQRGITLGVALAAVQVTQQATEAAAAETLIETTIEAALAWNSGSNTITSDLISDQAVELAGKEIFAMTTTTKTALAVGLTLGGIALGIGGGSLLPGRPVGNADAAGLTTTMSVSRPAAEATGLLTLAGDPSKEDSPGNDHPIQVSDYVEITLDRAGSAGGRNSHENERPSVTWDKKARSANVIKIETALRQVTEVNFTDQPLKDVLDYLEDIHKVQIVIDVKALKDEHIPIDQSVNLAMSGITFKSALNLLLEPLSLDYVIKNEAMVITTKDKANETFETRVYNANLVEGHTAYELMELIIDLVEPDTWDTGRATRSAGLTTVGIPSAPLPGGMGAMPGMPGMGPMPRPAKPATGESNRKEESPPGYPPAGDTPGTAMGTMMGGGGMGGGGMGGGGMGGRGIGGGGGRMVGGMPVVLGNENGQGGAIRVAKNNTLVIRQTQRVHDEIVEFLNQLK
jgi:RNA polymerase sigma factor (sigma-70 family)